MRKRLAHVWVALVATGCSSQSTQVEPNVEVAPPPASTTVAQTRPARKRRTRVSEIAARAVDDRTCDAAARKVYAKSAKVGFALLIACIDQDKYRDLDGLFDGPWSARISKLPPMTRVRLATQVVAIRGANLSSDLPQLSSRGMTIYGLSDAIEAKADAGALVLFRGTVVERKLKPTGAMALAIAEIGRATIDRRGRRVFVVEGKDARGKPSRRLAVGRVEKLGSVDKRFLTGVVVEADVYDLPLLVREGAEFVFLGKLRRVDNDGAAQVQILDVFKRGVILPDF
ncbi:MAG: hypothetical protein RIT81_35970 [Deltaproteobacteria bacterium]